MRATEKLAEIYAILYTVAMILCLGFGMIAKHVGNKMMTWTFTMIFVAIVAFTVYITVT